MVDAHAHPQMRKLTELISAGDLKRRCDTIGVKMVVACSTGPGDWEMVRRNWKNFGENSAREILSIFLEGIR